METFLSIHRDVILGKSRPLIRLSGLYPRGASRQEPPSGF